MSATSAARRSGGGSRNRWGSSSGLPESVLEALRPLNAMHRRFVWEYVGASRGNAKLAWERSVGPMLGDQLKAGREGTEVSSEQRGSYLVRRPDVKRAIEAILDLHAPTATQLIGELVDLAHAHLGPFIEWCEGGVLKVKTPSKEVWDAHRHWVKSVRTDPETGVVTHIEVHDALAAKRELAKIMKLYSDAPIVQVHNYFNLSPEQVQQRLVELRQTYLGLPAISASARMTVEDDEYGDDAIVDAEIEEIPVRGASPSEPSSNGNNGNGATPH